MAFLGIKVPELTGKLLNQIDVPGEKESISEYHITMLFFGKDWPLQEVSKTLEATFEELQDEKPFLVEVNKVDCFPVSGDEPYPIIARVDCDHLHKLNDKLKNKFDKSGIEYSKKFKDYKPHITLSFSKEKIEGFKIEPVQFEVNNLTLWAGDYGKNRLFVDFLLKGPAKEKESAFLLQKSDFFYKVAENPPQNDFTATYERRKI